MPFKMRGSAFKINSVATKSALKTTGTQEFPEGELSPEQRGKAIKRHNAAYPKGHTDHSGQPQDTKESPVTMKSPVKQKVTKVTSDDGKTTATTTKTKKRLFGGKKTTTTSTSRDKEGVDYVRGAATVTTTRRGGGKKKEVTIDPVTGKKTVVKYNKKGSVKKNKVKKGEYELRSGKSNKSRERTAIRKQEKIDIAAADKAYAESKKKK